MLDPDEKKDIDGRRARSERSKESLVKAILALIRENDRMPQIDEIAKRAGVSRRSVFRHFQDMESLHLAAIDVQQGEVLRRYTPAPSAEGSLSQRIKKLVNHRKGVYEFIAPMRKIAEAMRASSKVLDNNIKEGRLMFRAHVEMMFSKELSNKSKPEVLLHAIEAATSWKTWNELRQEQNCSVKLASQVMELTLTKLLEK